MSNTKKIGLFCLMLISFNLHALGYVGLDYKVRSMKGNKTPTYSLREVLSERYNSGEIYLSYRADSNVGFNVGFEQSKNKTHDHTFTAGELFLGDAQNAGDKTHSKTKLYALHLDVCGFYSETAKLDYIGQLGAAIMRAKIDGTASAGTVTNNLYGRGSYRIIPRVGLGMQYFMLRNFGLRVMANWEDTHMFRINITDEDGVRRKIKPFKQSWSIAFGVVGRF